MTRLTTLFTITSLCLIAPHRAQAAPIVDGQRTAADGYTNVWQVTLTDDSDPGNTLTDGRLYTFQGTPTSDLYVLYEVSLGFNDNTYGANSSECWGSKGHTFNDLLKSDRVGFVLKDKDGNVLLDGSNGDADLVIDYLATFEGDADPDYYRSAGVVEGKNKTGPGGIDKTAAVVTSSKGVTKGGSGANTAEGSGLLANVPLSETSLGRNMSLFPSATTDSSLAAGWENQQIYEFMISASVFAGTAFDINDPMGIVPCLYARVTRLLRR